MNRWQDDIFQSGLGDKEMGVLYGIISIYIMISIINISRRKMISAWAAASCFWLPLEKSRPKLIVKQTKNKILQHNVV